MTESVENTFSPDSSYQSLTENDEKSTKSDASETVESKSETSKSETEIQFIDIYVSELPNTIITTRNHTVTYYTKLATKSLRANEQLTIIGKGNNIDIAVSVTSILQEQHIASIQSIATGFDLGTFFGQSNWCNSLRNPQATMTFVLGKGDFGGYINGDQKKKMIDIFQKYNIDGYLTFKFLDQFFDQFFATKTQINKANKYLSEFKHAQKLNLQHFVEYSSILIHPLLKEEIFDETVNKYLMSE